ncbi:MAG: hypothetical protein CLLPBCKN_006759 [Chroococcidiopsis cubana SAG 39.79]|nr:hypothetical protein [Chroococcidiopsis cubana SAG 39.79]
MQYEKNQEPVISHLCKQPWLTLFISDLEYGRYSVYPYDF